MSHFRTTFPVEKPLYSLNHQAAVWLEGSCFAAHMSYKLMQSGWSVAHSSFGVLYHPLAIARCIGAVATNKHYSEKELIHYKDNWISLHHHSRFQANQSNEIIHAINSSIQENHEKFLNSSTLVVTFGTSYAWHHKSGELAGNCNRLPQQDFQKKISSLIEMTQAWISTLENIFALKSSYQVIFTVSPVRHTREGMVQNMRSKARLVELCHALCERFPGHVHYFPAFEIMLDDLRDYRFYEADMIHPSSVAVDYIWEKFCTWCMQPEVKELAHEVEALLKIKQHRPSIGGQEHMVAVQKAELEAIQKIEVFYKTSNASKS
jgi:hypothetical protein